MHSFSKALAGMGRTSEWQFPRTTLVFLSSEGSGHNEGAAHVGQCNAVGTARKRDIGVLQEKYAMPNVREEKRCMPSPSAAVNLPPGQRSAPQRDHLRVRTGGEGRGSKTSSLKPYWPLIQNL